MIAWAAGFLLIWTLCIALPVALLLGLSIRHADRESAPEWRLDLVR